MKIIFFKAKYGNLIDKIIAWWTGGEYSHCLIVVAGKPFEVSPDTMKVEEYGTMYFFQQKQEYDIFLLEKNISFSVAQFVKYKLRKELGKKYDWLGIWLSQVFPFRKHKRNKWFCSELTAYALMLAGIKLRKRANCYSPNGLYKELKEKGFIK